MRIYDYECITTFWEDFSIADKFGIFAVKDTYSKAFKERKSNYKYLTELVMVLNHKIWQHYLTDKKLAEVYNNLWLTANEYAANNLKGEEASYFYRILD